MTTRAGWSDEDRDLLLAHFAEQRETCPGCGHPLDECRDPKTAQTWTPIHVTCEACRVKQAYVEGLEGSSRGVYVAVVRNQQGGGSG